MPQMISVLSTVVIGNRLEASSEVESGRNQVVNMIKFIEKSEAV